MEPAITFDPMRDFYLLSPSPSPPLRLTLTPLLCQRELLTTTTQHHALESETWRDRLVRLRLTSGVTEDRGQIQSGLATCATRPLPTPAP